MQFYYTEISKNFWSIIIKMIDDNYAHEYDNNDCLILGSYLHQSAESIKNSLKINSNNKIIVYQLEPLVNNHWWKPEHIIKNLHGADEVWDYDLINIEILRNHGINAKFKPILYSPNLHKIPKSNNYDIDILFYGTFTEHREKFFRDITRGVVVYPGEELFYTNRLVWINNYSGNDLDNFISRSKVVLNLNPHSDENRQQQTRIAHLLNNDKLVISEKAEINYFGNSIIQFENLNDFKYKILNIFQTNLWEKFQNSFKKQRSKIALFFHIDQSRDWKLIFENQIWKTQLSGLYDIADYIHIGISGSEKLHVDLHNVNRVKYNSKMSFENETLYDLWNFAECNTDYKILYLNTNINKSNDKILLNENINSWRKYIEYFIVDNWKACVKELKYNDCVGTELSSHPDNKYYLGNMWWANSEYIKNIDTKFLMQNQNIDDSQYWLTKNNPRLYNFYNTNKNHYIDLVDYTEYNNILEKYV